MKKYQEQRSNREDGSSSRSLVPTHLVERPNARFAWLCGFAVLGTGVIVVGVLSTGPGDDYWVPIISFGIGAGLIAWGATALRWSIVADRDGVTITNLRHRSIPWAQLQDVLLVKVDSDIDLGFHHLVFLTHTGDAVRPAAPTGWNSPGRKLPRLQSDLLAMRDCYAPDTPEDLGGPLDGTPAPSETDAGSAPDQPTASVWDVESWRGPEQAVLVMVAVAAPVALMILLDEHLPEGWADVAAVPILGFGDLLVSALFILVYGSARTWLRPRPRRSPARHRPGRPERAPGWRPR